MSLEACPIPFGKHGGSRSRRGRCRLFASGSPRGTDPCLHEGTPRACHLTPHKSACSPPSPHRADLCRRGSGLSLTACDALTDPAATSAAASPATATTVAAGASSSSETALPTLTPKSQRRGCHPGGRCGTDHARRVGYSNELDRDNDGVACESHRRTSAATDAAAVSTSIDWQTGRTPAELWADGIPHLRAFITEHGHTCVFAGFVCEDGMQPGAWVMHRRRDRRLGADRLIPERVASSTPSASTGALPLSAAGWTAAVGGQNHPPRRLHRRAPAHHVSQHSPAATDSCSEHEPRDDAPNAAATHHR